MTANQFLRLHLRGVERTDSADLRGDFVRLDRNERVEPLTHTEMALVRRYLTSERFTAYPDPKPLQDRLATLAGLKQGWALVTNGSDAAIRRLCHACLELDDRMLVPAPTYEMYAVYGQIFQARVERIEYPLARRLAVSDIVDALRRMPPKMLCLVNPDQPTGAVLRSDDLKAIVTEARASRTLVVVDEAYWFPGQETAASLVPLFDNLAVTRSFSKAFGFGGVRLGVLYACPEIIDAAWKVKGLHEVNNVALAIGEMLLDHPEVVTRYVSAMESGRALLRDFCNRHRFSAPACPAAFQLVELPAKLDPADVAAKLKAKGWLIKGGFKAKSLKHCVRISLAGPEIMARFLGAFDEVLNELSVLQ